MSERDRKILAAIAQGIRTSAELAQCFRMPRARMSVVLSDLAGRKLINSPDTAPSRRGRPCKVWRVSRAAGVLL